MNGSDNATGYSWVSIALHWVAALIVMTLWVIGSSIVSSGADAPRKLALHTSIALSAYLLLWARIWWRLRAGHPPPLPKQRGIAFSIGRIVHFVLLFVMAAMLITGPLTLWLRGDAIHLFALTLPSPFSAHLHAASVMHQWHVYGANLIFLGIVLHIAGALKHVAFNKDGTLERILIASKSGEDGSPPTRG